jgi:hypothetical protein
VRPRRRFIATTDIDHDGLIFPNLAKTLRGLRHKASIARLGLSHTEAFAEGRPEPEATALENSGDGRSERPQAALPFGK